MAENGGKSSEYEKLVKGGSRQEMFVWLNQLCTPFVASLCF
jgi:hypothetical protein